MLFFYFFILRTKRIVRRTLPFFLNTCTFKCLFTLHMGLCCCLVMCLTNIHIGDSEQLRSVCLFRCYSSKIIIQGREGQKDKKGALALQRFVRQEILLGTQNGNLERKCTSQNNAFVSCTTVLQYCTVLCVLLEGDLLEARDTFL